MLHQVPALQEFHGDEGQVVFLTGVEDGDDMGVLQPTGGFRLAEKALTRIRQLGAFELGAQRQRLDGHGASDLGVTPLVDHAHGAFAELFLDPVAAEHGLLNPRTAEQQGAARVGRGAWQHHGFRQTPGPPQTGLHLGIASVQTGHVFVDRLHLVELALALEVQRQLLQVVHQRPAVGHAPEPIESQVELALPLQRQPHHAVGFGRLFIGLHLARFGGEKTPRGQHQMPQQQQRSGEHQRQPGGRGREQAVLHPQQQRKQAGGGPGTGGGRQARQQREKVGRHQQQRRQHHGAGPDRLPDEVAVQDARRGVRQDDRGRERGRHRCVEWCAHAGCRGADDDDLAGVFRGRNLAGDDVVERVHGERRAAIAIGVELGQHGARGIGLDARAPQQHRLTRQQPQILRPQIQTVRRHHQPHGRDHVAIEVHQQRLAAHRAVAVSELVEVSHAMGGRPDGRQRLLRPDRGQAGAAALGQRALEREGGQWLVGPALGFAQAVQGRQDHVAGPRQAAGQARVRIQLLFGRRDEAEQVAA